MTRATREAVYAALFAKLQSISAMKTTSRRLQNVQDVQPEAFPAAYQLQGKQATKYAGANPASNTWRADWLLYAFDSDPASAPSIQLNGLIDAAVAVLSPPPGFDKQSLGGLVEYCAIDGDIEVIEGVLGDRAVAVIPIVIVIPGF